MSRPAPINTQARDPSARVKAPRQMARHAPGGGA